MKQLFSLSGKALLVLALCMHLSNASQAQAAEVARNEVPGQIRYTGMRDQMMQFDVNLAALPARTTLSIYDEGGNLLHEEQVYAGVLNKRYIVPLNLCSKLRFELTGKKVLVKKTFDIARQQEERVVVTAAL